MNKTLTKAEFLEIFDEYGRKVGLRGLYLFLDWDADKKEIVKEEEGKFSKLTLLDYLHGQLIVSTPRIPKEAWEAFKAKKDLFIQSLK